MEDCSAPWFLTRMDAFEAAAREQGHVLARRSTSRSYVEQTALHRADPNIAADPDAVNYMSPWGWYGQGSWHMIQRDGYSYACDYTIVSGGPWKAVHIIGAGYGVIFPIANEEPWHAQPFDWLGIAPAPLLLPPSLEDDMDVNQLAAAFGYAVEDGRLVVPLLERIEADGSATFKNYTPAQAQTYTHQELKMRRLREGW